MVGWKPVAMRFNQFIAQLADVIDRQFGGSVRVEQRSMVDSFALARNRRLDA